MARVAYSFNFEATSPQDALDKASAWAAKNAATVRGPENEATIVRQINLVAKQAVEAAKELGIEGPVFVEITGRPKPDPESRSEIGVGYYVSKPYPK